MPRVVLIRDRRTSNYLVQGTIVLVVRAITERVAAGPLPKAVIARVGHEARVCRGRVLCTNCSIDARRAECASPLPHGVLS